MTDYPVRFDKCPNCGSNQRIVEEKVSSEIAKGNLPPGTRIPALVSQAPIYNPQMVTKLIASRPVNILVGFYDVCADCGTLYCIEMLEQSALMSVKPNNPPMNEAGSYGQN